MKHKNATFLGVLIIAVSFLAACSTQPVEKTGPTTRAATLSPDILDLQARLEQLQKTQPDPAWMVQVRKRTDLIGPETAYNRAKDLVDEVAQTKGAPQSLKDSAQALRIQKAREYVSAVFAAASLGSARYYEIEAAMRAMRDNGIEPGAEGGPQVTPEQIRAYLVSAAKREMEELRPQIMKDAAANDLSGDYEGIAGKFIEEYGMTAKDLGIPEAVYQKLRPQQ